MNISQIKTRESGIVKANRAAMIKAANDQVMTAGQKVSLEGGGSGYRQSALNYGNYFNGYSPQTYNLSLFRIIRNMITFIDTAIVKMGLYQWLKIIKEE